MLRALRVDGTKGLSESEVVRRRHQVGANSIAGRARASALGILARQLRSTVVLVLIVSILLGVAIGEIVEAVAVLVVLTANTVIGFATELRAARSMEALSRMVKAHAEVERDDRRAEVAAEELVPGDIVGLEAGEVVPADVRLVEANDLTVDESALTGESLPVGKSIEPVAPETPLAERRSMALMGTLIRSGRARGVVVATGRRTEVGHIAELVDAADPHAATPMQRGLERLGRGLSVVVLGLAVVLAGVGRLQGQSWHDLLEITIALAIAVVPEGLPAVATLTLTVGMHRMARRHALVRRLPAVEALGSTTVICSDKTGTLTANRMEVTKVHSEREGDLWVTAVLCNDADVAPDEQAVGDPTEVALLHAAQNAGVDWRRLREHQPRDAEVPFRSESKRMATVHRGWVHVKGAPEALLSPVQHPELVAAVEGMGSEGMRTLAFARRRVTPDARPGDHLFEGLEVLGVVGIQDPPRPEAISAIATCHRAGIRVAMITGDRPDTARSIGRQLGLRTERVLTGTDLESLSDEMLARATEDVEIFARVVPEQKLRIVRAFQALGHVVAVTGDGVNDAPALRHADIGVAMGRSGTDVAREAADLVLIDDNFATIEAAVEEGRRIFTNIRRFAQFLFSWHFAEVVVIATGVVLGLPPPLAGLMVLWNNLIIDVIPSFALALEPGGAEAMRRGPPPRGESVVNRATIQRIIVQGSLVAAVALCAYGIGLWRLGLPIEVTQTLVFVVLSGAQLLAVFNARNEEGSGFRGAWNNPWLWVAIGLTVLLEMIALFVAPVARVLGLAPMPASAWVVVAILVPLPLLLTQVWRVLRRRQGAFSVRE